MREYMNLRYHRLRAEFISLLGGVCVDCGDTEELEFDHRDRTTKLFDVSKILTGKRERVLTELAKCDLRCDRCHQAKTTDERSVEHGGGASGKKNCPCVPCKARKAEYMRMYYLARMAE